MAGLTKAQLAEKKALEEVVEVEPKTRCDFKSWAEYNKYTGNKA